MSTVYRGASETPDALNAARHICQEARVVLTSLRGGPPAVARGELAQDLMELRAFAKARIEASAEESVPVAMKTARAIIPDPPQEEGVNPALQQEPNGEDDDGLEGAVLVQRRDAQAFNPPESPIPTSTICNINVKPTPKIKEFQQDSTNVGRVTLNARSVGPFAHPFLAVVMDPRAAGPHTLVALRALFRLLEHRSLVQPSAVGSHGFFVHFEPLMRGVLACKFEQTDAGADEAVEMAIADLLSLLVSLDHRSIPPDTLMDAFNTVFVTRNTFVHSPALCYHFEDVLSSMVSAVFAVLDSSAHGAARLIMEFLVNQLLHTPLVGGEILDESAQEAQMAHDATRVLCLHLVQCCLRIGWGNSHEPDRVQEIDLELPFGSVQEQGSNTGSDQAEDTWEERSLLQIIQDDLCLSLLMTGQAIWSYHDSSSNISPGIISLEVLSEICATLSTLWNTVVLRRYLVSQFETIFTGFYQRALALLRKRRNPTDSASFNANLVFDEEVEIILESLVDLLCLHDDQHRIMEGEGGALETLFSTYDCHMSRSDVATGLMVELCRCCGGKVGEDGEILSDIGSSAASVGASSVPNTPTSGDVNTSGVAGMLPVEPWRAVPAHLKELCVETLLGSMKCLFRDDHPNAATLAARVRRSSATATIPKEDVGETCKDKEAQSESSADAQPSLRNTKSKKQLMRRAAHLFNKSSKEGIQYLVSSGLVPSPATPASVASFLRSAIVVGLDKKAVGAYLGEVGKAPVAGKSPPCWERDWFHKDVLSIYCSLFRFERQSLLDGLRMFLAAFRLPGEAQQIDRILQAFSDSCGRLCDESSEGRLKLFSPDPKKASDAAYLLSFSIIMLNTDLHNDNIREDRKMKMEDFVKNNTDYGQDITDPGHELPREFLESIYESIRDEEIRTEGEGADGHMTVERWKDVLRGPVCDSEESESIDGTTAVGSNDCDDLREMVLEIMWMPIISTIAALWGVKTLADMTPESDIASRINAEGPRSGMLGSQGARLGMDVALDMLKGIQKLGRIDIFRNFFLSICSFTGLLGTYTTDAVDRTWSFVNSVESQSAVIVAIQIARDAGADIGSEGWKCVWGIIFELRDLKLFRGRAQTGRGLLAESETDFLTANSRREWTMQLVKGGYDDVPSKKTPKKGIFASLFGTQEDESTAPSRRVGNSASSGGARIVRTGHGKEELVVWDDLAPSDDEDVDSQPDENEEEQDVPDPYHMYGSAGAAFESQLIHEDMLVYQQEVTPVTGLERVEDTRQYHISPRARVRKRLDRACDFAGLISESRFLDLEGIRCLLMTLLDVIHSAQSPAEKPETPAGSEAPPEHVVATERQKESDNFVVPFSSDALPISPASVALAEILVCEVALKNRDRLGMLWKSMLRDHYIENLRNTELPADRPLAASGNENMTGKLNPGIEKRVTGLLRICSCAILREDIANDVTSTLVVLCPSGVEHTPCPAVEDLDKHLGEGLWRICRNVDGLQYLGVDGWEGLLGLAQWCACRGGSETQAPGMAEDDPALQAFRSLHLMLHAPELQDAVPFNVVGAIRALIVAGERGKCPKLSMASLDLLQLLHTRLESLIGEASDKPRNECQMKNSESESDFWITCWLPVLEGMADAAEYSGYSSVREHALSLLTDAFIDTHGRSIPAEQLCIILQRICIPLAGKRITALCQVQEPSNRRLEEAMTEFELCIGLLFKPFLHHLKNITSVESDLLSIWRPMLVILEYILVDGNSPDRSLDETDSVSPTESKFLVSAKELANEHLRNAVMVLVASGILKESLNPDDISSVTWASVAKMPCCREFVDEWKASAMEFTAETSAQPGTPPSYREETEAPT